MPGARGQTGPIRSPNRSRTRRCLVEGKGSHDTVGGREVQELRPDQGGSPMWDPVVTRPGRGAGGRCRAFTTGMVSEVGPAGIPGREFRPRARLRTGCERASRLLGELRLVASEQLCTDEVSQSAWRRGDRIDGSGFKSNVTPSARRRTRPAPVARVPGAGAACAPWVSDGERPVGLARAEARLRTGAWSERKTAFPGANR